MRLRGRAVGGPHDGVILEAGPRWTGFIRNVRGGRYVYSTEWSEWIWTLTQESQAEAFVTTRRDARGYLRGAS